MLERGQDFKGLLVQGLVLEMKLSSDLSWMVASEYQGFERSGPLSLGSFCHTLKPSFCDYAVQRQEFPSMITPWVFLPFTAFLSIAFTVSGNKKKDDISISLILQLGCYFIRCFPILCPECFEIFEGQKRSLWLIFSWNIAL